MREDVFNLHGLCALIVDDNAAMRNLMLRILRSLGADRILQAGSGREAMLLIRDESPDFITLDHRMEGMDGVSVAKMIRTSEDSPNPYLPILMVTGYAEPHVVTGARDAGVNEFIAKPVSVEMVAGRLANMISSARPYVKSGDYFGPDRRRRKNPPADCPRRRASDPAANADSRDEGLAMVD
ncbi:MAG: response regulator [Minwuia sp.]|uniref:response regulator n=1 Tax=Minwuia sp. TaxID=2493630 RepID=UPI003A8A1E40